LFGFSFPKMSFLEPPCWFKIIILNQQGGSKNDIFGKEKPNK